TEGSTTSLLDVVYDEVQKVSEGWAGRIIAGVGKVGQNQDPSKSKEKQQKESESTAGVIRPEKGWVVREGDERTSYPRHSLSELLGVLAGPSAPAIMITPPQTDFLEQVPEGVHYGNGVEGSPPDHHLRGLLSHLVLGDDKSWK